ncbi:metal binding domain of Ada domain-containing protein [Trichoderma chlorosporum]
MDYECQSISPVSFIPSFENDNSRWQAVKDRDIRADGCFVTAARATKVYCRPVCKSRLPLRRNILFYATGQQAQSAGFRACKRCKPQIDGLMPEERSVQKIREFLQQWERAVTSDENLYKLSLSQMAKQANVSKWYFHRLFKKYVGMTPVQYLRTHRNIIQLQSQDLNILDQFVPCAIDWPQITDLFADSKASTLENILKVATEDSELLDGDFFFPPMGRIM